MEGGPATGFPEVSSLSLLSFRRLCRRNVLNKQGLNVIKTTLSNRFSSVKKKKGGGGGGERASIVLSDSS